jgi:hypothetical protein
MRRAAEKFQCRAKVYTKTVVINGRNENLNGVVACIRLQIGWVERFQKIYGLAPGTPSETWQLYRELG